MGLISKCFIIVADLAFYQGNNRTDQSKKYAPRNVLGWLFTFGAGPRVYHLMDGVDAVGRFGYWSLAFP